MYIDNPNFPARLPRRRRKLSPEELNLARRRAKKFTLASIPASSPAQASVVIYLVSLSKVLELDESLMIQGMWPDSCGGGLGTWTIKNRKGYERSHLRYPRDLTDEEWQHIAPLIRPAKHRGRNLRRDKSIFCVRRNRQRYCSWMSTSCRGSKGAVQF